MSIRLYDLIVATGYVTRLYFLLEVKGKAILDWLNEDLELSNKIDEYVVISNHKYVSHFNNWKDNNKIGNKITILDDGTISNETRLGAVKDIELAIKSLNINDDLMVIAGDNLLDFSLVHFVNYFESKNASCVMRYYEENLDKVKKSAELLIDSNDRVLEMNEKPVSPKSNWCCPPFYIYTKLDVKKVSIALEDGCRKDAPGSFIEYLSKKSPVYAMEMPGDRYDIGNLESYKSVCENYKSIIK